MAPSSASPASMQWRFLPLCRSMTSVAIDSMSVLVQEKGEAATLTARWAIGVLPDGQYEALGVSVGPVAGEGGWRPFVDDLSLRGLERVRFVVHGEPMEVPSSAWAVFPGATVMPSIGQLVAQSLLDVAPRDRGLVGRELARIRDAVGAGDALSLLAAFASSAAGQRCPGVVDRWQVALERLRPLYALGPRQRRIVISGDDLVQGLRLSLARAVGRHGVFADREAVVALVGRALLRAERGHAARTEGAGFRAVRPVGAERSHGCYGIQPMSA